MRAIEIARKLAALGSKKEACQAYTLVIHEGGDPAGELEAAAYILQAGGNYKTSYTCFIDLYNRGCFREEILPLMNKVFYEPNVKLLRSRYERNCKQLKKYPYIFRKDFLPFDELPVRFFPYDDNNGYIPFYLETGQFGNYINFKNSIVSRNFFHDLEKPVLADDVYSQYELEYLCDNVRKSEYVGRENHLYLHYTGWGAFCSYLQCLNVRPLLKEKKPVFLIEDEIEQYPIDFKKRFGIDYSQCSVKPVGIQEMNRLIWHTQLSSHNGGDFFNEVMDAHPNLVIMPSLMFDSVERSVKELREALDRAGNLREAMAVFEGWKPYIVEELWRLKGRSDKDIMIAMFLNDKNATACTDPSARIVPALFFQPHFSNIIFRLQRGSDGQAVLYSGAYEKIRTSPLFQNFKYIKTFTPMRRITTSHAATVRFMYLVAQAREEELKNNTSADEKHGVVDDEVIVRVLNRSFMIDWQDRLYKDSVLVRFEDGKLNPKATFTALAAFLDLPYTESLTYCSEYGNQYGGEAITPGNVAGFDPASVYRTYDEYASDTERSYLEYFLRDAYEYYGYRFQYYDGQPVDKANMQQMLEGFSTIDHYIRETWKMVFKEADVQIDGEKAPDELENTVQNEMLDNYMRQIAGKRLEVSQILLEGLHFVNKNGQPLRMMPRLQLDPELLEQPLYH